MDDRKKPLLNKDSVVLVTGGAKGITSQCAIGIAEAAGCTFILVGRSQFEKSEPEWAKGVEKVAELKKKAIEYFKKNEEKLSPKKIDKHINRVLSNREIAHTIGAIESHGGKAVYVSADITDEEVFCARVKSEEKKTGSITGVIHGAGNLADKLIENKTERDYDLVVNTKVNGLRSIIHCVDAEKLDFVVLFSSVAGFFGNIGQTDYAIANEVLNKSAYILQRSLLHCLVISINWGPWDSGMVTPQLKKYFESHNIPLISAEQGIEKLLEELTNENPKNPQTVIGGSLIQSPKAHPFAEEPLVIHRTISLKDNPFVEDHRIGQSPVLPATCASAWLIDACESINLGWQFHRMEDFKVLKGITFDENDHEFELVIKRLPTDKQGERVFDVMVVSENGNNGRKKFHYSGMVVLMKDFPQSPRHPELAEYFDQKELFKNGSEYYHDGTLFHGPSFKGIQSVMIPDEKRIVSRIYLPQISCIKQGQFVAGSVNAFLNDAIVQNILIWSQETYQSPCLPSRLHEWIQYKSLSFDTPAWAVLTIGFHNQYAVSGDIVVVDDEGNEYFHFTGLEGTISKQLNRYIGRKAN